MDLQGILIAVLGAGGITGAVRAWLKSAPETESISVETLRAVIEELRTELNRLAGENRQLHEQISELRLTISALSGDELPPEYS